MIATVKDELTNMMLYSQYNDVAQQMNIISKCNKLLSDNVFSAKLKQTLDAFFQVPTISLHDFGAIVLAIGDLIPLFETVLNLYQGLEVTQMQFIVYGLLYSYMYNHANSFLSSNELGKIRIEFSNMMQLIKLPAAVYEVESKLVQRLKEWVFGCVTCGRYQGTIRVKKN